MVELFVIRCPNCGKGQGTQAKTIMKCRFCEKSIDMKKINKVTVSSYKLCAQKVASINRKIHREWGGYNDEHRKVN